MIYHDLPIICPNFLHGRTSHGSDFHVANAEPSSAPPSLLGPTPRPSRISRVMARLTTSREAKSCQQKSRDVFERKRFTMKKIGKTGFDHEKCFIWWFDPWRTWKFWPWKRGKSWTDWIDISKNAATYPTKIKREQAPYITTIYIIYYNHIFVGYIYIL